MGVPRGMVLAIVLACVGTACSSGSTASTVSADLGVSSVDASSDPCAGSDPKFVFYSIDTNFFPAAACRSFIAEEQAGQVVSGGPTAPTWVYPTDGGSLPGDDWVTFYWAVAGDAGATASADGFVIEFQQNGSEILRVMVLGTQWPVDLASWTQLKSAAGTVTATVVEVPLVGNGIDASVAPIASSPIGFTISP
jgi:hypothetical protein